MGINKHLYKFVVAALCVCIGFSGPLAAQTEEQSDRLETLFDQLLEAEPEQVSRIEGQIVTEWSKSGSAAMDLLLRRAEDAVEAGTLEVAVDHFTALIDHAPDFAEGYNGRASTYYRLGRLGPAIDDLRMALVLEPRHFGAMAGVAYVLEELGRPEDSLEVWRKIEEISPADPSVAASIERLQVQLQGQTL